MPSAASDVSRVVSGYTRGAMKRLFILALALLIGVVVAAQTQKNATVSGDWPMYSYNLAAD